MEIVLRVVCDHSFYIGYEPYSQVFSGQTSFPMVNGCLAAKWIMLTNQATEAVTFQFPGGLIEDQKGEGLTEVPVGANGSVPVRVLESALEDWYTIGVYQSQQKLNPLPGQLYVGTTSFPNLSNRTTALSPGNNTSKETDEIQVRTVERAGDFEINYAPLQNIQALLREGSQTVANAVTRGGGITVINDTPVLLDFVLGDVSVKNVPPAGRGQLRAPVEDETEGLILLRVNAADQKEELATGQLIILTQPMPDPDDGSR